jgi:hypothetical protein
MVNGQTCPSLTRLLQDIEGVDSDGEFLEILEIRPGAPPRDLIDANELSDCYALQDIVLSFSLPPSVPFSLELRTSMLSGANFTFTVAVHPSDFVFRVKELVKVRPKRPCCPACSISWMPNVAAATHEPLQLSALCLRAEHGTIKRLLQMLDSASRLQWALEP